ncbi:transposase [Mucilaginibacter arboris]|uniref:transposase n=1 Tax=Mucilaginibacter arboris TaxID=2682090 RepID=UPI0018DB19D1
MWQFIKKTLQFDERKRKYSLRPTWDAISYLVKFGCLWRMLPANFAKGNWFIIIIRNGLLYSVMTCFYPSCR